MLFERKFIFKFRTSVAGETVDGIISYQNAASRLFVIGGLVAFSFNVSFCKERNHFKLCRQKNKYEIFISEATTCLYIA